MSNIDITKAQLKEVARGSQDAMTGKPYSPRSDLQKNPEELDLDFYISGWTNAICNASRWRKTAYRISWKLEHLALRIGSGKCGLKIK